MKRCGASVVGAERLQQVSAPGFVVRDQHFVETTHPVVVAPDRQGRPVRFPANEKLDAMAPVSVGLGELDVIEDDEDVRTGELVEVSEPWKEIRLMDGDDGRHESSSRLAGERRWIHAAQAVCSYSLRSNPMSTTSS